MCQRHQAAQREVARDGPHQKHFIRVFDRAGKAKTQSAIAAVMQPETDRTLYQPRKHRQQNQQNQQAQTNTESKREVVTDQQQDADDAPFQYGNGIAVVIETVPQQRRVAIEILQAAHLGPGRVNPQREYRQREIDDPDAKVFAAVAGKFDLTVAGADAFRVHGTPCCFVVC